mgnify:CR=1 FL=1|jgi:hypothetical protein
MKKIEEVTGCIQRWCSDITRKQPDIEKMSNEMYEELAAYESCLDVIETAYNLEATDKVTQ